MTAQNAQPDTDFRRTQIQRSVFRVTEEMERKIAAVIDEGYRDAANASRAVGKPEDPPYPEFLVALAEESLILRICGATPDNDVVGEPTFAKGMA